MAKKIEHILLGKLIDEIGWSFGVYPKKLRAGNYYIQDPKYGLWEKKQAEVIAQMLRDGFILSVIHDAMNKIWHK